MQGPLLYLFVMLGLFVLGVEGGKAIFLDREEDKPASVEKPLGEPETDSQDHYSGLNS